MGRFPTQYEQIQTERRVARLERACGALSPRAAAGAGVSLGLVHGLTRLADYLSPSLQPRVTAPWTHAALGLVFDVMISVIGVMLFAAFGRMILKAWHRHTIR